jgi:hypothetical protein
LSCLPRDIDMNNLNSFSDEQWYGFNQQQRAAIWALRNIHNQRNRRDDVSLLGQESAAGGGQQRHVAQISQAPSLPPAPDNASVPQPPAPHQHLSTKSTNAGSAFGR